MLSTLDYSWTKAFLYLLWQQITMHRYLYSFYKATGPSHSQYWIDNIMKVTPLNNFQDCFFTHDEPSSQVKCMKITKNDLECLNKKVKRNWTDSFHFITWNLIKRGAIPLKKSPILRMNFWKFVSRNSLSQGRYPIYNIAPCMICISFFRPKKIHANFTTLNFFCPQRFLRFCYTISELYQKLI